MNDKVTVHTPDGVELYMPLAGVGSRALAGLIDLLILGVVWVFVGIAVFGGLSS